MARKPNYDYEKRRKEMERKAKKDAKREDRLRRKRDGDAGDEDAGDVVDEQADGADAPEVEDGVAALADESAERG